MLLYGDLPKRGLKTKMTYFDVSKTDNIRSDKIEAKEEIAHNVFQLYSVTMLSFILNLIEIFHIFAKTVSKSSTADLINVGKGYRMLKHISLFFLSSRSMFISDTLMIYYQSLMLSGNINLLVYS